MSSVLESVCLPETLEVLLVRSSLSGLMGQVGVAGLGHVRSSNLCINADEMKALISYRTILPLIF